ncbi:hypothetical protein, partial [Shewanella holmiensis]
MTKKKPSTPPTTSASELEQKLKQQSITTAKKIDKDVERLKAKERRDAAIIQGTNQDLVADKSWGQNIAASDVLSQDERESTAERSNNVKTETADFLVNSSNDTQVQLKTPAPSAGDIAIQPIEAPQQSKMVVETGSTETTGIEHNYLHTATNQPSPTLPTLAQALNITSNIIQPPAFVISHQLITPPEPYVGAPQPNTLQTGTGTNQPSPTLTGTGTGTNQPSPTL